MKWKSLKNFDLHLENLDNVDKVVKGRIWPALAFLFGFPIFILICHYVLQILLQQ